jgi:hypothetical protein
VLRLYENLFMTQDAYEEAIHKGGTTTLLCRVWIFHLILEISPINLKWNAGVRIPVPLNSLPTPLESHQELLLHRQILILQTQSSEWHPTGLVSVRELTPVKFVCIGEHERRSTVQRLLAWKSNVSFSRDCLRRAMTKGPVNTMYYCVLRYTARIEIQKEESKLKRFVFANRLQSIAHCPSTPTSNDGPRRHRAIERERDGSKRRQKPPSAVHATSVLCTLETRPTTGFAWIEPFTQHSRSQQISTSGNRNR